MKSLTIFYHALKTRTDFRIRCKGFFIPTPIHLSTTARAFSSVISSCKGIPNATTSSAFSSNPDSWKGINTSRAFSSVVSPWKGISTSRAFSSVLSPWKGPLNKTKADKQAGGPDHSPCVLLRAAMAYTQNYQFVLNKVLDNFKYPEVTDDDESFGLLLISLIIKGGYQEPSWTLVFDLFCRFRINLQYLKNIFEEIEQKSLFTWTRMINAYLIKDQFEEGLRLFIMMWREGNVRPNYVTYSRVLYACGRLGDIQFGKQIHALSVKEGLEEDLIIGNYTIHMYGYSGYIQEAERFFTQISMVHHINDPSPWSFMIKAYGHGSFSEQGFNLFEDMKNRGVIPSSYVFASLLTVCQVKEDHLHTAKQIYHTMVSFGISPHEGHIVAMTNILAKNGLFEEAQMIVGPKPTHSMLGAILRPCVQQGNLLLGEKIFSKIKEIDPNNSAYNILMENLYKAHQLWDKADEIKKLKVQGERHYTGLSWIEVKKQ